MDNNLALKIYDIFNDNPNANVYVYLNCETNNNTCIPKKVSEPKYDINNTQTIVETYYRDLVRIEIKENNSTIYAKKTSKGLTLNNDLIVSNSYEEIQPSQFPNVTEGDYTTTKIMKIYSTNYEMLDLLLINNVVTIKIREKPTKSSKKKKLIEELSEIRKEFF